jgi:hypothetical protein
MAGCGQPPARSLNDTDCANYASTRTSSWTPGDLCRGMGSWSGPQHTGGHRRHRTRIEGPGRTQEGAGDHEIYRSPEAVFTVRTYATPPDPTTPFSAQFSYRGTTNLQVNASQEHSRATPDKPSMAVAGHPRRTKMCRSSGRPRRSLGAASPLISLTWEPRAPQPCLRKWCTRRSPRHPQVTGFSRLPPAPLAPPLARCR